MSGRLITYIAAGAAALLIFFIAYQSVSAWVMWGLLPQQASAKLFLAAGDREVRRAQDYLAGYGGAPKPWLTATGASRLAYADTRDNEVLVILPYLTEQFKAAKRYANEGWYVRRVGFLLCASQSQYDCLSSSGQAVNIWRQAIFSSRLPARPLAIGEFRAKAVPLVPAGLTFVVESGPGRVVAHLGLAERNIVEEGLPDLEEIPGSEAALTLKVPGTALLALPDEASQQWNEVIRERLHLEQTAPDIIKYLARHAEVGLSLKADQFVIAATDKPEEFRRTVTMWLSDEQARHHLVRRAFKLPDGTLGYEEVPGEPAPVFAPQVDAAGCYAPQTGVPSPVWLCQQASGIALASSQETALAYLARPDSAAWQVAIGSDFVEKIGLPELAQLTAQGQPPFLTIVATLNR